MAAECGVAAVMIVGVQPDGKFGAAFGIADVEAGVGPFVGQGAVEAFNFPVGLRTMRSDAAMLDRSECISERVAQGVGLGVVGEDRFDGDAMLGEPALRPGPERGGGRPQK